MAGTVEQADQAALIDLYVKRFGMVPENVVPLRGDGSDRRIYRLTSGSGSCIGISGSNVHENRAFLSFTSTFRSAGLAVPEVYGVADDELFYLLEDLGDTTLYQWARDMRADGGFPPVLMSMYESVVRELVRFQVDAADLIDYSRCYQYAEFGGDAMRFDVEYFRSMFLDTFFKDSIDERSFHEDTGVLIQLCLDTDRGSFLYRDFQSRNIMIKDGVPRFIDYQSGRRGAPHYDPASLLYDARAEVPEEIRSRLVDVYISELSLRMPVVRERFLELFDGYALLRVMQALGAFGNLGMRKGRTGFLEGIPPGLKNLRTLATRSSMLDRCRSLRHLFLRISDEREINRIRHIIGKVEQ